MASTQLYTEAGTLSSLWTDMEWLTGYTDTLKKKKKARYKKYLEYATIYVKKGKKNIYVFEHLYKKIHRKDNEKLKRLLTTGMGGKWVEEIRGNHTSVSISSYT